MKLLFVASTRIPTERAMGVAVMKQCEAFARAGLTVELVVPKRHNEHTDDPYYYHDVAPIFSIRYLWSLDLAFLGEYPFRFSLQKFTFFMSLCLYVARSNADIVYSRELLLIAPLITTKQKFVDLHHLYGLRLFGKIFLDRCTGVISLTKALGEDIARLYTYKKPILSAPSGVDLEAFNQSIRKEDARAQLGITSTLPIAMYIGSFEEWKGYRTFLDSLRILKGKVHGVLIGGTPEQTEALRTQYPEVQFLGSLPQRDLPRNQQAADVLVVPNSAHEVISARHTSPLKLIAHMASGIPIVGSSLPSLTESLTPQNAILVKPDDPHDLACGIWEAIQHPELSAVLAKEAKQDVLQYDWNVRARSILAFISLNQQQSVREKSHFDIFTVIKQYCISNRKEIAKYIVVGGVATIVDLSVNYVLNFYIWYLYASVLAFFLTFATSFTLQKFWTFRERKLSRVPVQLSVSLSFALIILMLNTALMYVLVSYGHIHYLHARIVVLGVLAVLSYIVNKFVIFR